MLAGGTSGLGGTSVSAGMGGAGQSVAGQTVGGQAEAGQPAAGQPGAGEPPVRWSESALASFNFVLLGSAKIESNSIVLTDVLSKNQAGGLGQLQEVDFTRGPNLHVSVRFRIEAGEGSGDGMAIVFQSNKDGAYALGRYGGGLGYAGLVPCVAIELDTQSDADLPAPHLAVIPDCESAAHGPSTTLLGGDPRRGGNWRWSVDWDASTTQLRVQLVDEDTGGGGLLEASVDLIAQLGSKAYVTVVAANGEATATHRITALELGGAGLTSRSLSDAAPLSQP